MGPTIDGLHHCCDIHFCVCGSVIIYFMLCLLCHYVVIFFVISFVASLSLELVVISLHLRSYDFFPFPESFVDVTIVQLSIPIFFLLYICIILMFFS